MYKSKFLYPHVIRCLNSNGTACGALTEAEAALLMDEDESKNTIQFSRDVQSGMYNGDIKRVIETDYLKKIWPMLVQLLRERCTSH